MRILYFYQYFTTPNGAWSTRAYEFARRWTEAGHRVTLVTGVYDRSDLQPRKLFSRTEIDGIDVRIINIRLSNKHGVLRRLLTFAAYAVLSCWYALTLPADVVLASSGPLTVGLPGLMARFLRRRPLVFEVRDLWPEGAIQLKVVRNPLLLALAKRFERLCYRSATRIVALSDGMAAWIHTHHGLGPVDVVPNACDNAFFAANGCSQVRSADAIKKLVVYTGAIGPMDNCLQIVKMAESLWSMGERAVEVVLIGDGKEKPAIESYARKNDVRNVRFLGLLPKKDVADWLRRADCALVVFRSVPCLDTVSPNKMFDAFAAGVPVVQTTQGWIKDLLEREQCGITVPPEDPRAMAEAVRSLIRDEPLRQDLARNSRRVALELFDRGLLAANMERILLKAAQEPTRQTTAINTGMRNRPTVFNRRDRRTD